MNVCDVEEAAMPPSAIVEKDLLKIFRRLKVLLKKYAPPLVSKIDLDSRHDLWSVKDVVIKGRPRKGGSGGIYHGQHENEGKEILSGG